MIATNQAADVLRHGWQDAANSFAADVPEVADLLQTRVEMAIASQELDEQHLLDTIEEVVSITSRAGSSATEPLARRLRRTVYEYLLALDAAQPLETSPVAIDQRLFATDGPMVGAEEVAALGHAALVAMAAQTAATPIPAPPGSEADGSDGDEVTAEGRGSRRRFGLRRRSQPEDAADADSVLPEWEFPLPGEPAGSDPTWSAAETGELATEPAPSEQSAAAGFVAPRAGFHIVDDDGSPQREDDQDEAPIEMPVFSTDGDRPPAPVVDPAASVEATATDALADSEFLAWHGGPQAEPSEAVTHPAPPPAPGPSPQVADAASPSQAASAADPVGGLAPVMPAAPPATADDDDDDNGSRGWRVRQAGRARGAATPPTPEVEDDPFGTNPKLADIRRRIEDRLRRKRCDEAAAMLQGLAQDTGGRAVADLAMNAGDRCRALGKTNAALNCYLAASRADPVYELPLSRLADVCIDAQDTELAVTYLERIARLYRYRGDDRQALRVYRRIATIAPYREDVLTLLMNAQRTGRFD